MEYVRFGNTGLKVSRVCVGCMSYGSPEWQGWVLSEEESLGMIKKAWDTGINFFDTADMYSNGLSEKILGKAIKEFGIPRNQIVIATKVFFAIRESEVSFNSFNTPETTEFVNHAGLSRKHIFEAVDGSLKRLGVDYIDLYQIHRFDYNTPVEETMEALHDLVKSGKVRYIGASSMYAWQFAKMNAVAEKNGWTKFVSMQNFYNLLYREEEREMIPLLKDQGIAMIPWSPLARGALSGKSKGESIRPETDLYMTYLFNVMREQDNTIIGRVVEVAEKLTQADFRGDGSVVTPSQVALAWIYSKDYVTAPIVGFGKEKYFDDIVLAIKMKLADEDIKYLESPYMPKPIVGHF